MHVVLLLIACQPEPQPGAIDATTFTPAPVPELITTTNPAAAPVYLFLFTHTEDHFNHELSEERYTTFAPLVADLAVANPEANLAWTIEFQGADAKTVLERDGETGIATMLKAYADDGVIEFGYHAHHDPNYNNRPQKELSAESSWEEKVQGMDTWVSCEKDPVLGGCEVPEEGGILAVAKFGPVQIVTGLHLYTEANVEHDATVHASRRSLPSRRLGFGYPDHGSIVQDVDYVALRDELVTLLTPSVETSGTLLWADNILRINDGDLIGGTPTINLLEGENNAQEVFDSVDRSRPHVFNTGLASKYLYTAAGTSPTIYGYSHRDSPELPEDQLVLPSERAEGYRRSEEALTRLVEDILPANPGSRFVRSSDVLELAAPAAYYAVSAESLDVIARWVLLHWDSGPPNFVSDGTDFYSLRDAVVLLSRGIAEGYPDTVALHEVYGPFGVAAESEAQTAGADAFIALASTLAQELEPDPVWQETPSNLLQGSYEGGTGTLDPAQLLYGLAMVYASTYAGQPVTEVALPAGSTMPATLEILVDMGCADCQGTAWSLKPARIRAD